MCELHHAPAGKYPERPERDVVLVGKITGAPGMLLSGPGASKDVNGVLQRWGAAGGTAVPGG
ncbi:hypothetical protein GCM10029978_074270 [Actinoallomurus acanthiterrae]